jgi:ketosteroid isomerase-like protein
MTSALDLFRELNDAVAKRDLEALGQLLDPDVVWRHNIGAGSPEEGDYEGREKVVALFDRILEPWVSFRAVPAEVREVAPGVVEVEGELHAQHGGVEAELVTPYAQRLELRNDLLVRGVMVTGSGATLPEFETD